ncbi:MAG: hypothetical protein ACXV3C_06160 [Actinomycetes bacterium]
MSSLGSLLVGVVAVCAPAALPLLVVLGRQWVALFLAPVVGAVLIGFAAVVTVALAVPLVTAWLCLAVLVNALALVWWRRGGRPLDRMPVAGWTLASALFGSLLATAWASSRALSWDVHSFWYSRGRWFLEGPHYVIQQLSSPYTSPYPGSPHAKYPPVPSATPGLMWDLTGHVDYFSAKMLLAGITASTLVLLALAVASLVDSPRWLAGLAALLVPPAALYFATSSSALGHMDLPYAAAGEAALIFGLLLPRRRAELVVSVALCLLCSFVKNEGFVIAVLVALLVSLRYARRDLRRFVLLAVPWLAAVGSWRMVVMMLGAGPPAPTGQTQADELAQLRPLPSPDVPTLLRLGATHLWWLAVPLAVGLLALLLLAYSDRRYAAGVLRPVGAAVGYHALIVVPLLGATGLVIMGGPGLPWAELVLRTARYVTFSRLALTVCLLVVAASALRVVRRPADDRGRPSSGDERPGDQTAVQTSGAPGAAVVD